MLAAAAGLGHARKQNATVFRDQDMIGGDVAVDVLPGMHLVQCLRHRREVPENGLAGEAPTLVYLLAESELGPVHDGVDVAVGALANVTDLAQAGQEQMARHLPFATEVCQVLSGPVQGRFEGHVLAAHVAGMVDGEALAPAYRLVDGVLVYLARISENHDLKVPR